MTQHPPASDEAIKAVAELYGAVLADPEQAAELLAARERQAEIDAKSDRRAS